MVKGLRTEQARGSFNIARFYEKNKKWRAAAIYYNDVVDKDPASSYAQEARERIDEINRRQANDES
jgi:outer membrane protein assembly factor BamD